MRIIILRAIGQKILLMDIIYSIFASFLHIQQVTSLQFVVPNYSVIWQGGTNWDVNDCEKVSLINDEPRIEKEWLDRYDDKWHPIGLKSVIEFSAWKEEMDHVENSDNGMKF